MNCFSKAWCYIGIALMASYSIANTAQAALNSPVTLPHQTHDEHIVWRRAPINITLPLGKERFVTFPSEVQFGYNIQALPSSVLRVENDNRTVYLLAKQPFSTQRVEAKLANGDIILMDIQANKHADDDPVDIVLPQANRTSGHHHTHGLDNTTNINYVTLMRYAIQQLYAPKRLLKHSNTITRFPMETTHVVPLFLDGSAAAMPLASWRGGDWYVTALLIKNLLPQALPLDPRLLCGDWKAASVYPQTTLAPHGTPINRDTTTLFVISTKPFADAMQVCLH